MTLSPELLARVDGLRGGGSRSSQVELLCWAALGRRGAASGGSAEPRGDGSVSGGREASRERSVRIQRRVRGF
jgi:hypothetical protein